MIQQIQQGGGKFPECQVFNEGAWLPMPIGWSLESSVARIFVRAGQQSSYELLSLKDWIMSSGSSALSRT
jgi:hypothetical protein